MVRKLALGAADDHLEAQGAGARANHLDGLGMAVLVDEKGVFVAASDYLKALPATIAKWLPGTSILLGTDGYGRSDARKALREHFEVDRRYIAVTALNALAVDGMLDSKTVATAIEKYGIDPDRPDPVTL